MATIGYLFAGIPVTDYSTARAWYVRLFGREPDVNVAENECMWQLATAGWVYVVEDPARAGHALVTVLVDNLADHVAELNARGIPTGEIETLPGAALKSAVIDADGNKITFGQALSSKETAG